MSGKRAFLELLKQEGVEILFGNPGTTELPLMDALAADNELRYVLALQEAAVMAMADGYAQAAAPILVTAGQHDQSFNATEPILWADLPPLARPLVKWSSEVHRLADLPRIVHRAAKTALAPPTGPVFLSLPADIMNAEADIELSAPTRIAPRLRGDLFTLSLPSPVEPVPRHLTIIHLDIDPWELGKNDPAQVAILGDPKATLPEITAAVRTRMTSGARMRARERLDAAATAIAAAREELKAS